MLVHLKRAGAVAFLAAAGALLSSACVQDESSIFIRGCLQIPRDTCTVQASTTASFVLGGQIDGLFRSEYTCAAMLENQLVPRGDVTKLRTETSGVTFYEAEVQILTNDEPPQLVTRKDGSAAQFSVPITGYADPGTGGVPGLGVAFITLLDFATLNDLATTAAKANGTHQLVVAAVIVKGRTLGGLEVHSDQFKFPIDVCGGCLCTVPAGDTCVGSTGKPTADCELGQDDVVDCRLLDACTQLECGNNPMTHVPSLAQAHCPAQPLAVDKSCCNAGP